MTFTLSAGRMRVAVCKDDIIRIQYANGTSIPAKTSLSVNVTWPAPTFCVSEAAGVLTVATARLKVKVVEATGVATFTDPKDNVILAEDSKTLTANTVRASVPSRSRPSSTRRPPKRSTVSASIKTAP